MDELKLRNLLNSSYFDEELEDYMSLEYDDSEGDIYSEENDDEGIILKFIVRFFQKIQIVNSILRK